MGSTLPGVSGVGRAGVGGGGVTEDIRRREDPRAVRHPPLLVSPPLAASSDARAAAQNSRGAPDSMPFISS